MARHYGGGLVQVWQQRLPARSTQRKASPARATATQLPYRQNYLPPLYPPTSNLQPPNRLFALPIRTNFNL